MEILKHWNIYKNTELSVKEKSIFIYLVIIYEIYIISPRKRQIQ